MCKIPVIFKIKLTVEEAKDKIGVGEESHRQTCNRPPTANFFVIDGLSNNRASKRMSDAIHKIMITWKSSRRQLGEKTIKWVERIVFTEKQEVGYWEKFCYPADGSIPGLKS